MAKYNYDETGATFNYFLLSFLAIVLIPSSLSSLWPKQSNADDHRKSQCSCSQCKKQRQLIDSIKPKLSAFSQIPFKLIFLAIGWTLLAFTAYRVATTTFEETIWDPYAIMNLGEGASAQEVGKAYRTLSRTYHPDKNRNKSPEEVEIATQKYIELSKAYKVLTDEDARKNWEEFGHPDGKQSFSLGIALPTWLVESGNRPLVLLIYALVFGVGLPIVVARWWYASSALTKDKILVGTMGRFYAEFKDNSTSKALLDLLTIAEEFKHLTYDPKDPATAKLIDSVRRKLDDLKLEQWGKSNKYANIVPYSPKVSLLLTAHLLRVQVEDAGLASEQAFVVTKATQLVASGLMQIAATRQWLNAIQTTVEINQIIAQAIYPAQSNFLQLPYLNKDILVHFTRGKRNVRNLGDFLALKEDDRRGLLKALEDNEYDEVMTVAKQIGRVKIVSSKFHVPGDKFITPNALVTLKVNLALAAPDESAAIVEKIGDDGEDKDDAVAEEAKKNEWWNRKPTSVPEAHAPLYPDEKRPAVWWVILGNKAQNRCIRVKLQFQAPPNPTRMVLQVYIKSDAYCGTDLSLDMKLEVRPAEELGVVDEDDDISEPDEDTIAGQMAALRNAGKAGAPGAPGGAAGGAGGAEEDDSDSDDDEDD
ncbi:Sec63 Brl domain-containing protein [Cladochytrium replicatum]|nr:Sec63 Brl domain-containing protein [Cladochytrium replicatum]